MSGRRVIALVGLSGVGKSTLLASVAKVVPFTHFQASALIKDELQHRRQVAPPQDALREAPIDTNQALLIASFRRNAPMSGLLVLDGHTIIDTPTSIIEVGPEVFRAIEVCRFVVLVAPPEIIVARRNMDHQRKRPERTIEEIHQQQEQSLASARSAAHALGVPISIIEADESHELAALLTGDAVG